MRLNVWEVTVKYIAQTPSIYEVWDEIRKDHPAARMVDIKWIDEFEPEPIKRVNNEIKE